MTTFELQQLMTYIIEGLIGVATLCALVAYLIYRNNLYKG